MNIGIVGHGIVGSALSHVFKKTHPLYIYDRYKKEYQNLTDLVNYSDFIFICVPTPMRETGEIDLSYVEDSLDSISKEADKLQKKDLIVIIKSTVLPGTTEDLSKKYENFKLIFNPEFLTERNFLNDMEKTDRVIIGAKNSAGEKLVSLYKTIFKDAKYLLLEPREAEMVKYASNILLASQISMANEIYNICLLLGINYNKVKEAVLLDKRIGSHINVPGNDRDFGFGGKCLPKDLNALMQLAKEKGYSPNLLEEVWRSNLKFRKRKDWLEIKGATSQNSFRSIG